MYFLYYIFFIITLLISVACNNYIEMTDSDITVDDITKTIPNADTIVDEIQKIATVAEPTVISTDGKVSEAE
jgi:hypothetical protein